MSASSASTAMWSVFPFNLSPTVNCTRTPPLPITLGQTFLGVQPMRGQGSRTSFADDVSCSAREKSQPRNGAGEIFITAAAEIVRETVSATNRVGRVRLTRGNVGGSRQPGNKTPETGALPERWVTVHSGDMGYTQ